MESDRPEPPEELAKTVQEVIDRQDPEMLRRLSPYVIELADWKEAESEREVERKREEASIDEELPDHVKEVAERPSGGAVITKKEINGHHYYYWQWWEGDKTKSEYIAPVDPKRKSSKYSD